MTRLTIQIFNLRQRIREVRHQPPLLCHALEGQSPYCRGCKPGSTFQCAACGRLMPWCMGATDDYEACCDHCWAIADRMEQAVEARDA